MSDFEAVLPRSWMARAKCLHEAPALFDPLSYPPQDRKEAARDLCRGCPVIGDCALFAVQHRCTEWIYAGEVMPPSSGHSAHRVYARLESIARKHGKELK